MRNFIQEGKIINVTVSADVSAGTAAKHGAAFGAYVNDAKNGGEAQLCVDGVVELPKDNSNISQCAIVYWDDTAKKITTTATSNSKVGYATEAAGAAATLVRVKLIPTL